MFASKLQQIFNLTDEETGQELVFNQMWHHSLDTNDPKKQYLPRVLFGQLDINLRSVVLH
jgi:hypothetical protein